jgi:hypothetical protein
MIRNFLFSFFFFTGITFISLIFLPAIFLPKKIVLFGGKIMGYWSSLCLKKILSTKIIVKGTLKKLVQYQLKEIKHQKKILVFLTIYLNISVCLIDL